MRQARRTTRPLSFVFLLLLLLEPLAVSAGATAVATVVTQSGGRFAFQVEIADTPAARERGLMFRPELAADAGMLFLFEAPEVRSFWMKNTEIPLDMLFLAADGRVVDLHANAVPYSTQSIVSKAPAQAVLEVAGGTAQRLGIRVGDRVEYPALQPR